jgi:prevent-host-death family protein
MPLIGVWELRERTSEVLRQVREEGVEYVVTYWGQPIAMLLPVDEERIEAAVVQAGKQGMTGGWEAYSQLAEQARKAWPSETRTQELLGFGGEVQLGHRLTLCAKHIAPEGRVPSIYETSQYG